jgi:hypothetical protein
MIAFVDQLVQKLYGILLNEWFSASKADELRLMFVQHSHYLLDGELLASLACIFGIAPGTLKIASDRANEDRRRAD